MGIVYGVGIPALFGGLRHGYMEAAQYGCPISRQIVGFLFLPFRRDKEWWFFAELFRVLLLTSTIGWFAKECWYRVAVAQFLSLFFLLVFLYHRPCPYKRILPYNSWAQLCICVVTRVVFCTRR